jgi:GTP cyclohydrolase I
MIDPIPKEAPGPEPTDEEKHVRKLVERLLAYAKPVTHKREDLEDTPRRVQEWLRDFVRTDETINFTTFSDPTADQVVAQTDIRFYSLCEHHVVPFFGSATVAYLPDGQLVGLSKLARLVRFYARRLQTQERMTRQISDFLSEELDPRGVAVVTTARHLCMEMRGVEQPDAKTTTSRLTGIFKEDSKARTEFLQLRDQHR